ncbi:MAG TPA: vitamin K epoxide reductase family protein [Solirubrobacterales bacterium]
MPSEGALRNAGAGLALLGTGIAAYIAIAEAGGGAPACVGGSTGCATVAASPYADVVGSVNVSELGVAGYLMLFGAALVRGDPGRFAGAALALIGLGYTIYLNYVEFFVIEAVCQWCVASAVTITALFAVSVARLVLYGGRDEAR